jgi:hypothetical protein
MLARLKIQPSKRPANVCLAPIEFDVASSEFDSPKIAGLEYAISWRYGENA